MANGDCSSAMVHNVETAPEIDGQNFPEKVFTLSLVVAIISLSLSFVISLSIFLLAAPVLGIINEDLGPDASYVWVTSAYTVVYAVSSPLYGSLADIFGRRWFAVSAGFFVSIGSLIAALAQSIPTVIAGMAIIGVGGAGGIQCVSAVSEIVPRRWRGPIVGFIEFPFFLFTCAGAWFSQKMSTATGPGWRSVYWVGVASGAAFALGVVLTYKPEAPLASHGKTKRQLIREFDYLGFAGLTIGLVLFLVGINYQPRYGSTSVMFLAPLIVGILTLVATGFQQVYWARSPILHPYLWTRFRTFTLQAIVVFVSGMLFYSLQALYPLYMSTCYVGNDAQQLGLAQMPLGVATVGGVVSGLVLPRLARHIGTQWVLGIGVLACALFIALLAVPSESQQNVAMGLAAAASFGIGWTNLLSIPLIQLCAPDEWIGFATGLRTLMSLTGGSVATAIYSTIYANKASIFVPREVSITVLRLGLPESSIDSLLGILTGATPNVPLSSVPGINEQISIAAALSARRGNIIAFRYVWYSSIPFGVTALVAALMTTDLYPVMTLKIAQRLAGHKKEVNSIEDGTHGEKNVLHESGSFTHLEKVNT